MEQCLGNRMKMRQFLVFRYPEEAGLDPFVGRRNYSGSKG